MGTQKKKVSGESALRSGERTLRRVEQRSRKKQLRKVKKLRPNKVRKQLLEAVRERGKATKLIHQSRRMRRSE